MATFRSTVTSTAVVKAPRPAIWKVLTDPDQIVAMTPLLRGIDADGDTWVWRLQAIRALGVGVTPVFTEQMTFDEASHIGFTHAPPPGSDERVGAEGSYDLSDTDDGTHLAISLTLEVQLPLPSAARFAVQKVMRSTMDQMGKRFAANLTRAVA